MYDVAAFTATLTEIAHPLPRDGDPAQAVDGLLTRLIDLLDLRGGAVGVHVDGGLRGVLATSPELAELERVQEQADAGPALSATRSMHPVAARDVRDEAARWPAYAAAAAEHGCTGLLAMPMCWEGRPLGGVSMFSREPRVWTGSDLRRGRLVADALAEGLHNVRLLLQQRRLSEQLQTALNSRVIIEQAKGMVARERGIAPDVAFEIIRQSARRRRLGLHDVARGIVQHGLEP